MNWSEVEAEWEQMNPRSNKARALSHPMSPARAKWPPRRALATGYTVAIAVLLMNLVITFLNIASLSRTWDALGLSHDAVAGLEEVLSNLRDAETGQRGYLLTGDERYLEPYTRSHNIVA